MNPMPPLAFLKRAPDTVKNSREHIQTSALAHYHTGYKAVSHNLKDTEEDSNKLEQLRLYSHKELSAPLKDEEFQQFAKGKSLGPTTLGQRMKILEQTLNREEEELQRQWEEYQAVETELESLAAEIGISNGTNLSAVQASKFFGAMGTEMQKGLEIEKARFVEMMLQHGKESLKRMKASEKVAAEHFCQFQLGADVAYQELNFQQKKNQNFILKMFENEW